MSLAPYSRVGIVLRTKDRPYFLARALEDVASQSFTDWHIIIANDQGDRSAVEGVVEQFRSRLGDRVSVLDVPAPGGRCAAANTALRALRSDYIVLHDDDDWWAPQFLEVTVAWLDERPDDGGVAVATDIVYEQIEGSAYIETGRAAFWAGMTGITLMEMLDVNHVVPISFLYRASLHDEVGFYDERLDAVEDWEFYLRVLIAHPMGFVPGPPLAFWSQRPDARGADGNSMFALGDVHKVSDTQVRDRALADFARSYGPGLPLYISWLVRNSVDESLRIERERFAHPGLLHRIWSRLVRAQKEP